MAALSQPLTLSLTHQTSPSPSVSLAIVEIRSQDGFWRRIPAVAPLSGLTLAFSPPPLLLPLSLSHRSSVLLRRCCACLHEESRARTNFPGRNARIRSLRFPAQGELAGNVLRNSHGWTCLTGQPIPSRSVSPRPSVSWYQQRPRSPKCFVSSPRRIKYL